MSSNGDLSSLASRHETIAAARAERIPDLHLQLSRRRSDLAHKLEVVRGILPRVPEGAAEHRSYRHDWERAWAISVTTAIHGLCRSSADLDFVDERLEMLKKAVESGEDVSRILLSQCGRRPSD